MIVPAGNFFRPTDEELLNHYMGRKMMGLPLSCNAIIEREIYGVGDKAPWQIFTDQDPWEICKTRDKNGNLLKTESTIYVLTTLVKASQNRIARTAGCGTWHAETALAEVFDDLGRLIGYKRMLSFLITDKSGVIDESVRKGHWIMHEYSLCGTSNTVTGKQYPKVEYVICRIKMDDSKCTKKSLRKPKNAITDDVIVPKSTKRAKLINEEEDQGRKKMGCDMTMAPEIGIVPFSEKISVPEQNSLMIDDSDEFSVEELEAISMLYPQTLF